MKLQRTIIAKRPATYNELANYVNNHEIAIFVTGTLYDETLEKVRRAKLARAFKVLGPVNVLLAASPVGWAFWTFATIFGVRSDSFKHYKIHIDKNNKRIELLYTKGENGFDPKYDTVQ